MSRLNIKDIVYIDIKIDGEEVMSLPNMFSDFTIIENVNQLVPTLSFSLNDETSNFLKEKQIVDGTLIDIKISKNEKDDKESSKFRVFNGATERVDSSGHYHNFNCVLDVMKYVSGVARTAIKGSTSEALAKICTDCKMTFKGESTNDSQIWISAGMTYNQWARQLTSHAFKNVNSCMIHAVNENKEFLYIDIINKLMSAKPVKNLVHTIAVAPSDTNSIVIAFNESHTASGLLNCWVNYGYIVRKEGVDTSEIFENIEVKVKENSIAQNAEVKKQVGVARIDILPFNCGNTYANYEKSYYQNFRLKSTFTESLSVIILEYSDIKLLDIVEVKIGYSVYDQQPTIKSGSYLVVAKTKIIKGGISYGERLELIRNSIRSSGSKLTST